MKTAALLSVVGIFIAWLTWNLWNLLRITTGLRKQEYRRPMWWTRVFSVALFADFSIWTWGVSRGGIDVSETCGIFHGEHYDEAFRQAHSEEFQQLFPLHNKCNRYFDLVAAWINPSIVALTLLSVICLCVVVQLLVRDHGRKRKKSLA
jgi:hypothetical protein